MGKLYHNIIKATGNEKQARNNIPFYRYFKVNWKNGLTYRGTSNSNAAYNLFNEAIDRGNLGIT